MIAPKSAPQASISLEKPVSKLVENGSEVLTKSISKAVLVTLSNDRPFDVSTAAELLPALRAWSACRGNLYDHLTGKHSGLVPGKDFAVFQNGEPDMESYRRAIMKKTEGFLSNPETQLWMADFAHFLRKNPSMIDYETKSVSMVGNDGKSIRKNRYCRPFFVEQGWLYYEGNHFDEVTGKETQPNRRATSFRCYLNPRASTVFATFEALVEKLSKDPVIAEFGFQAKTANVSSLTHSEAATLMNQKDRIIFYFPRECLASAKRIISEFANARPDDFTNATVPLARHVNDSSGKPIPGIALSSETVGTSPDKSDANPKYRSFSDLQEKIILSCLRSFRDALVGKNHSKELVSAYPTMFASISELSEKSTVSDFLRVVLASKEGEGFLCRNLANSYALWAASYGISDRDPAFLAKDVAA